MEVRRVVVRGHSVPLTALVLVLAFVALVAIACSAREAGAPESREATIAAGRQLFASNCAPCHGEKGDRVPVAPLNIKDFLDMRGDATLVHVISEGKGVMPAWGQMRGGPLSADQINSVVAYLNASAGRTSPTILANSGRTIFQQQCVRCHGDKGDRIPAAPLAGKGFLDSVTDGQLAEVIGNGKGQMPAFRQGASSPLSEDQIRALVSYLRYNAETTLAEEARKGRDLYLANCLGCHGERGDRVPNVALGSPELLRHLGDGVLASVMSVGKGVMPGFGPVKGGSFQASEIGSLLAYLKSSAGLPAGAALVGPEMPSQGRDLYIKNCASCHGEGGDKVAGLSLRSREFLDARSDDALKSQIDQGNSRGMPAWGMAAGGPLSSSDVKNLVDYLRGRGAAPGGDSAPATAKPPAVTAPIGATSAADSSVTRGKEVYAKHCSSCHGDGRDRLPQAKLADPAWLQQRGDAALGQSITIGKEAMPSWGKEKGGPLDQDDIAAVLAYLKATAGVALATSASAGQAGAATGDASKGQALYTKNCAGCHGESRDKILSAKLADITWLENRGDAALAQSIANGKEAMPSWSKDKGGPLGQDDITAILSFLKTAANGAPAVSKPAGPPPVLSVAASRGQDLFGKICVACHGPAMDKIPAAKLADSEWLTQRGDAALSVSIANGKGAMPAWGKDKGGPLSTDDIAALLAYLKALASGGS